MTEEKCHSVLVLNTERVEFKQHQDNDAKYPTTQSFLRIICVLTDMDCCPKSPDLNLLHGVTWKQIRPSILWCHNKLLGVLWRHARKPWVIRFWTYQWVSAFLQQLYHVINGLTFIRSCNQKHWVGFGRPAPMGLQLFNFQSLVYIWMVCLHSCLKSVEKEEIKYTQVQLEATLNNNTK